MTLTRRLILPLILAPLVALSGCGGDPEGKPLDMGGDDGTKIATVIEDINDAVGNPKKLDTIFMKGSKPSDPKKMAKSSFTIVGKPTVSGTTATAKVRVEGSDGKALGEVEWKFQKEGDQWKITDAPIP